MKRMKPRRLLTLNDRRTTLFEFGRIVHVGQDDEWIYIRNEESAELFMKKRTTVGQTSFKCENIKL